MLIGVIREHVTNATASAIGRTEADTQTALLQAVLGALLQDEPCILGGDTDINITMSLKRYEWEPETIIATATALCSDPRCAAEYRGRPLPET